MDRNVFALIAGTVFLLFIINAIVQMQTALVREAAGGIGQTYSESTWETAGAMYILTNDETSEFGVYTSTAGFVEQRDGAGKCVVDGAPYFEPDGPLELSFYEGDDSLVSNSESCTNPSGYSRAAPIIVSDNMLFPGVEKD